MNLTWKTAAIPWHTFVTRDDGRDFCEIWNRGTIASPYPFKVYWVTAATINGEDTYRTLEDVEAAIAEASRSSNAPPPQRRRRTR